MKEKLSRIKSPWRRLLLSLVIGVLVALSQIKSQSVRARVHWLGRAHRPRRLERIFLFVVMVLSTIILEPRQYMLWVICWGGGVSLFVIIKTMHLLAAKPAKV